MFNRAATAVFRIKVAYEMGKRVCDFRGALRMMAATEASSSERRTGRGFNIRVLISVKTVVLAPIPNPKGQDHIHHENRTLPHTSGSIAKVLADTFDQIGGRCLAGARHFVLRHGSMLFQSGAQRVHQAVVARLVFQQRQNRKFGTSLFPFGIGSHALILFSPLSGCQKYPGWFFTMEAWAASPAPMTLCRSPSRAAGTGAHPP